MYFDIYEGILFLRILMCLCIFLKDQQKEYLLVVNKDPYRKVIKKCCGLAKLPIKDREGLRIYFAGWIGFKGSIFN